MKQVSSGSRLEGQIGFSRAVRVGNFIAIAGTAPIPGDSDNVDTWSVYEQTRLCLQIVRKAIEEAGGHLDNVIRTRIMLTDIATWREAAQAHGECFSNIKPACTFCRGERVHRSRLESGGRSRLLSRLGPPSASASLSER